MIDVWNSIVLPIVMCSEVRPHSKCRRKNVNVALNVILAKNRKRQQSTVRTKMKTVLTMATYDIFTKQVKGSLVSFTCWLIVNKWFRPLRCKIAMRSHPVWKIEKNKERKASYAHRLLTHLHYRTYVTPVPWVRIRRSMLWTTTTSTTTHSLAMTSSYFCLSSGDLGPDGRRT